MGPDGKKVDDQSNSEVSTHDQTQNGAEATTPVQPQSDVKPDTRTSSTAEPSLSADVLFQALSKMMVRKDKPRIPSFAGRDAGKRDASFGEWYHVVEKTIQRKDEYQLTEQGLTDIIFASLTGEARSRFIRLDDGSPLDDILSAMKKVYSDQTTLIDQMQALHMMSQNKNESISGFADRLETASHKLKTCDGSEAIDVERTLKVVFMRGISLKTIKNLMEHLRDDPMKTYDDVRIKAEILEKEQIQEASHEKKLSVRPVQSELERTVQQLSAEVASLKESLAEAQASKMASKPKKKTPYRCYYCDESGHFIRDCKKRKDERSLNA